MNRVALIPARQNSRRIPNKNVRFLGGKPLIRWTIDAALESEIFDQIFVCSDDFKALALAQSPVRCWQRDPVPFSQKDIEWISDFLETHEAEEIWLLRPTSPFRGPTTLLRAHQQWQACKDRLDSLRAVRRATEPGWKQWVMEDWVELNTPEGLCHDAYPTMRPLTTAAAKKHLHSFPTQSLEDTYIQTAGLEVFHAKTITEKKTLAGNHVGMFLMEGVEALDLNSPEDWEAAEQAVRLAHSH